MELIENKSAWHEYRQKIIKSVGSDPSRTTENLQIIETFPVLVGSVVFKLPENRFRVKHLIVTWLDARKLLQTRKDNLVKKARKVQEQIAELMINEFPQQETGDSENAQLPPKINVKSEVVPSNCC